ncbi:MAG TPA: XRE family transcriptional regulator [Roseiarcus sp.]|nr:XRE family transcriptional regulator [Roseiarcus sp.]
MDDTTQRIAGRIRAERETRAWSLADLAGRSGVSRAMISKIERGESSPTAALLGKLSGAFGLTLTTLLSRAENFGERLCRRDEQALWRDPKTGYLRRSVVTRPELPLELTEIVLPPGEAVAFPREAYLFIRQAIWVLEGALEFAEGAKVHRLAAGDSLVLGEPEACRFHNAGERPCRYLVAVLRR